jgi:hypothetical protein
MATMPVIDALDRCKIALQYLAEGQSDSLTVVLELLVERLEDAIGQAHAQLRQCTCAGSSQPRVMSGPAPRGVLTFLPGSRQTSPPWASGDAEDLDAEDEGLCPDAQPRTAGTWLLTQYGRAFAH